MRNIVIIKYRRSGPINYGSFKKEDASFYCQGGEAEARTLQRWLHDNLIEAIQVDQATWDSLPNDYPVEAYHNQTQSGD